MKILEVRPQPRSFAEIPMICRLESALQFDRIVRAGFRQGRENPGRRAPYALPGGSFGESRRMDRAGKSAFDAAMRDDHEQLRVSHQADDIALMVDGEPQILGQETADTGPRIKAARQFQMIMALGSEFLLKPGSQGP